ncbi:MAG TPA: helix-turn-helix domain-containing protein [Gaiellaceae bacterium]|nr:helix-turn-helix domain-containing protein [Gaiellaceae bacterium]
MFEIGNSLREARLRQGLDFPEIEQATKIRGKYLRALEEEQFEVLPAQTYVKGFLRSYADYLGLDGQLYVDEFNSRYVRGEFEDEQEQGYQPRIAGAGRGGGTFQGKGVLLTVAVIAGLTVFFFAAWKLGGNGSQEALPPLEPPPAKAKQAKPKARLVASGVAGGSYIVVRRGSRTSKPIYSGTLENGKKQRFEGHRLWIYVYAPANLRLRLNGRARAVPGAGTGARRWLVVKPSGVSLAPSIG